MRPPSELGRARLHVPFELAVIGSRLPLVFAWETLPFMFGKRGKKVLVAVECAFLAWGLLACDPKDKVDKPATDEAQAEKTAAPAGEKKPEKVTPKERSMRLVVTSKAEPLGSEKAQLRELEAALKKAKIEVAADPATDDEKKAASALAAGESVSVEAWGRYETVAIVEVVPPEGTEPGKRLSRGRGHLFILHPPAQEPTFSTIYETDEKGAWMDGGKLGVWLSTHLRYRKSADAIEAPPEKHDPETHVAKKEVE